MPQFIATMKALNAQSAALSASSKLIQDGADFIPDLTQAPATAETVMSTPEPAKLAKEWDEMGRLEQTVNSVEGGVHNLRKSWAASDAINAAVRAEEGLQSVYDIEESLDPEADAAVRALLTKDTKANRDFKTQAVEDLKDAAKTYRDLKARDIFYKQPDAMERASKAAEGKDFFSGLSAAAGEFFSGDILGNAIYLAGSSTGAMLPYLAASLVTGPAAVGMGGAAFGSFARAGTLAYGSYQNESGAFILDELERRKLDPKDIESYRKLIEFPDYEQFDRDRGSRASVVSMFDFIAGQTIGMKFRPKESYRKFQNYLADVVRRQGLTREGVAEAEARVSGALHPRPTESQTRAFTAMQERGFAKPKPEEVHPVIARAEKAVAEDAERAMADAEIRASRETAKVAGQSALGNAGTTMLTHTGDMLEEAAWQGFLGGAGEYFGSKAAHRDVNMADVLFEMLGEFTSSPTEVFSAGVTSVAGAQRRVVEAQATRTFEQNLKAATYGAEALALKVQNKEAVEAWAQRVGKNKSVPAFAQDIVENGQIEKIRDANPELAKKIEDAAKDGRSVDIPVSDILSIATKDRKAADAIIEDCRPSIDGVSVREAEDFEKNGRKQAEQQFEKTLKRAALPKAMVDEVHELGKWVRDELARGGMERDYAQTCAILWQSYLTRRAKLLGVSPKEVANMMGWRIKFENGEVERDDQAMRQDLQAIDSLFQEEFGKTEKTYRETIDDFIGDDPARKKAVEKLLDLMSTERQKDVVAESRGKSQIKYQKTINSKVLDAANEAGVDLADRESPITRALLVQTIVNDAVYATRVNSSAIGWYDEKVRKCLGYAGAMFPELDPANKEYDPNEAFRFLYVLATTSNGLKVKENLPLAVRLYQEYKRTGTLPAWGQGTQAEPMIKTIADFEKTKATFDDIDQMRKFFMTTWTVKQLLTMGYNVAGESATESTRGAAIIGPKIGNGFFANLNGLFEALTMDRWFMRTFGRWTGTLIDFKPENFVQKVDAFREVLADVQKNKELCAWLKENGNFDVDEALRDTQSSAEMAITEMAIESGTSPLIRMVKRSSTTFMPATFRKEYSKIWGGKDKPKSIGWRFYSAMKAVQRAAASDKVAPAGSTERRYIRSLFNEALDVLHGMPELRRLSMADLQAALWYAEKKIYENTKSAGDFVEDYAQEDAPDYANVMRDVALKNGVPQSKIDEITKRIDKEIKDENGSSEGPVRARYDTLTPKERVHVFGTRCFANLRSNRGVSVENGAKQGERGASVYRERREVGPSGVRVAERGERNPASGLDAGGTGRRGGQVSSVRLTPIATWVPGNSVRNALRGYQEIKGRDVESAAPEFEEFSPTVEAAQTFSSALKAAKKTLGPAGACVEEKSIEELTGQDEGKSQCRIFLSPDRQCGFVIKNGDDLVSVFSTKGSNSGDAIVEAAIAAGARRLDCFNTILPAYYARHGFRPVARMKFDREYAPYDWDYDFYAKYKNGEPDIIFMVYDNSRQNSYDEFELEDLPYTDGEHYGEPYMSDAVAKYEETNKVVQESVDEANKEEAKKAAAKPKKTKKAAPQTPELPSLVDDSALFQDPVEQARLQALDNEYLSAVQSGDMDKAREMVEARAKEKGYGDAIPEQAGGWRVRTKPAPKKTFKAYKVFFVDEQGQPTTLFVGDPQAVPRGVWVDAKEAFYITDARTGRRYVPTFSNPNRVGAAGKKKRQKTGITIPIPDEATKAELVRRGFVGPKATTVTCVAYRPGWHAGTLPYFPQGGQKVAGSNYGMVHEARQVVFEIEVAADKDYTDIARSQDKAKTKSGKVDARKADLDYLPKDGMYFYTTNPMLNPAEDGWVISDSIKIVRALSQEECDALLAKAGKLPQEWAQGKLDLPALGMHDLEHSDASRKTLAPITYDNQGNIIPLSKRFDENNSSVLYQDDEETTGELDDEISASYAERGDGYDVDTDLADATVLTDRSAQSAQTGRRAVRGEYNPRNAAGADLAAGGIITLMKERNKSTFMHESAHAWLDADTTLALAIAKKARAGEELTAGEHAFLKNLGGFFAWGQREGKLNLGVDPEDEASILYGVEQWASLSTNDQRGMHELFARGFEAYLMAGQAPNAQLIPMFDRFRAWLKDAYAKAQQKLAPISPEVSKLFDLMFVSEQEVADAAERAGATQMFDDEDAKSLMTDEERAQYEALADKADQEGQSFISVAVAGVMKAFRRISDRERRKILKEHKQRVKAEAERLAQEPRYKAWAILTRGLKQDSTVIRGKLSERSLRDVGFSDGTIDELRKKGYVVAERKDGSERLSAITPELLAEAVGAKSPVDLIGELMECRTPVIEAADIIAAKVQEETGTDIDTYSRAKADLAAHTETRSRLLTAEHNAIARKLGRRQILVGAARDYALRKLGAMRLSDVNPHAYVADEKRCAREAEKAFREGNFERCLQMKQRQILNHEMARAALEIETEHTRTTRRLKNALKSKGVHPANKQLLAFLSLSHDIVRVPSALSRSVNLDVARKVAQDLLDAGTPVDGISVTPDGFEQSDLLESKTSVDDMTVDEARALFAALRQIEKLGRDRLTVEVNGMKEDLREQINQGRADLEAAAAEQKLERKDQRTPVRKWEKAVDAIQQFFYGHIKIASWCRIFDRNREGGWFWNHFIRSANERATWEDEMRTKLARHLQEVFAPLTQQGKGIWDSDKVKIGHKMMSKGERLAAALNLGNESNMKRLRDGEPDQWTDDVVKALEESLTAEEWQIVQQIWDTFESLRPLIGEKEQRVYGIEPVWIEYSPFTVTAKGGVEVQLKGGYYPVVFDPRASTRAQQLSEAEAAKQEMQGAFQSATTRRGFTKTRVETVTGRPLKLDLSALYSGLDDVVHDLAWHEWLINTNRLLNGVDGIDTGLYKDIKDLYGYHVARAFTEWAQAIAQGDRSQTDGASRRALQWLSGNVGVTAMGFSFQSAISQITGVGYIVPRAGVAASLGAVRDVMLNRKGLRAAIQSRSALMRTRSISATKEINQLKNRLDKGKEGFLSKYAYAMLLAVQDVVDLISWQAMYRRCMSEGLDEAEAIARSDQAVIDTQSSGRVNDLSQIERSEILGPFTVFYSWANAALNQEYVIARGEHDKAKKLAQIMYLAVVMPLIDGLFKECLKAQGDDDGDDDEEDWWIRNLIRKPFASAAELHFSFFVGTREISSAVKSVIEGEKIFDYSGPGGTRSATVWTSLLKTAGSADPVSWRTFDALVDVAGFFGGIPASQVKRTVKGIRAIESGQAEGFDALKAPIFGFSGKIEQ